MRLLLVLVSLVVLGGCASSSSNGEVVNPKLRDPGRLNEMAWLTGSWVTAEHDDKDKPVTEEHWTAPAGGTMLGTNRVLKRGKTYSFEYLRIEAGDGGIHYMASPSGRYPPTAFRLAKINNKVIVFENPQHDFPQKISYHRIGNDAMEAVISGRVNDRKRSERWLYHRVE